MKKKIFFGKSQSFWDVTDCRTVTPQTATISRTVTFFGDFYFPGIIHVMYGHYWSSYAIDNMQHTVCYYLRSDVNTGLYWCLFNIFMKRLFIRTLALAAVSKEAWSLKISLPSLNETTNSPCFSGLISTFVFEYVDIVSCIVLKYHTLDTSFYLYISNIIGWCYIDKLKVVNTFAVKMYRLL